MHNRQRSQCKECGGKSICAHKSLEEVLEQVPEHVVLEPVPEQVEPALAPPVPSVLLWKVWATWVRAGRAGNVEHGVVGVRAFGARRSATRTI